MIVGYETADLCRQQVSGLRREIELAESRGDAPGRLAGARASLDVFEAELARLEADGDGDQVNPAHGVKDPAGVWVKRP